MKKRLLSFLCVFTIFITQISSACAVESEREYPSFSDVSKSDPYYAAVTALAGAGVLTGFADGTFQPQEEMSREQFAAVLVRALTGKDWSGDVDHQRFSDVSSDRWSAKNIEKAFEYGLINGFEDGTFRPESYVTCGQAVTMLVRMLGGEEQAQRSGGYPQGYWSMGQKWNMFNGVHSSIEEKAKRYVVAMLICNALESQKGNLSFGNVSDTGNTDNTDNTGSTSNGTGSAGNTGNTDNTDNIGSTSNGTGSAGNGGNGASGPDSSGGTKAPVSVPDVPDDTDDSNTNEPGGDGSSLGSGNGTVWLSELDYFAGDKQIITSSERKDNIGEIHSHCIDECFTRTYKLNARYSKISGVIFQKYDKRSWPIDIINKLEIYGDGKLLYCYKPDKTVRGFDPIGFDVDLSGVTELKVVFKSYYNELGFFGHEHPLSLGDCRVEPV